MNQAKAAQAIEIIKAHGGTVVRRWHGSSRRVETAAGEPVKGLRMDLLCAMADAGMLTLSESEPGNPRAERTFAIA